MQLHVYPHCGLRIGRDVNAARNILALGRSAETLTWQVAASPVEWLFHRASVVSEAPLL